MAALIIVVGLLLLSLWCGAYGVALGIVAVMVMVIWPGRARSHQAQTMHQWHKRNR